MITRERAHQLRRLIEQAVASLSDDDALNGIELYPAYAVGVEYAVGNRFRYGSKLYKVNQAHTSQADWLPDSTPALYTEVAPEGVVPVWVQPTGTQDAYNTGDKVHYPDADSPIYESKIDNNVWSPEAYPDGWQLV